MADPMIADGPQQQPTTVLDANAHARPRVVPEDPGLREFFLRAYRGWLATGHGRRCNPKGR